MFYTRRPRPPGRREDQSASRGHQPIGRLRVDQLRIVRVLEGNLPVLHGQAHAQLWMGVEDFIGFGRQLDALLGAGAPRRILFHLHPGPLHPAHLIEVRRRRHPILHLLLRRIAIQEVDARQRPIAHRHLVRKACPAQPRLGDRVEIRKIHQRRLIHRPLHHRLQSRHHHVAAVLVPQRHHLIQQPDRLLANARVNRLEMRPDEPEVPAVRRRIHRNPGTRERQKTHRSRKNQRA